MLIFQCEKKAIDLIGAGLHGGIDELADVFQISRSDLQHIDRCVTGYFRLATLGIAVVGI
jgi:hypothetical protein